MKKLLMLMAIAGLGFSMMGCAESKPPAAPAAAPKMDETPAAAPAAAPAAEEKK